MRRYFCTYFDINFSPRGMALYESITAHCSSFTFIVLALDTEVEKQLADYPNIQVISLQDYMHRYDVDETKYATKKELYFSLTAGFCMYVLEKYPAIDILFYLDADIYFFGPVEDLYTEMGSSSIFITPHKVTPLLEMIMGYYGSFNVGINGFRNDCDGLACLQKWKQDCDAWSKEPVETRSAFFNDQLYLDEWPRLFNQVGISANPGINLAPWSLGQYHLSVKGNDFYVGKKQVVAFHFSDLKRIAPNTWETNSGPHLFYMGFNKKKLYVAYLQNVEKYYGRTGIKNYVSLNHRRGSLKMRIRSLLNRLTQSIVYIQTDA